MKLAVIIPTLPKNEKYAMLCGTSLLNNTRHFPGELTIHYAYNGEGTNFPQGQCQAVNRIAESLPGDIDWIMVSNDDMWYPEGWDMNAPWGNEEYLVWSPNLAEPNSVGSAPPFKKCDAGDDIESFDKKVIQEWSDNNQDYGMETGLNLPFIVRRSVWDMVGGYDTMYDPFSSNSDSDIQAKFALAGIQSWRERGCNVYHFGSKSETFTPDKQSYWQRNWDYFVWKWGFTRAESPDVWYSENLINYDELIFEPSWKGIYG